MSQSLPRSSAAVWVTEHGALLVGASSYILSWALWLPLLGRRLGDVTALHTDFLLLALGGGFMPALSVLLWRLAGGRIPEEARSGLSRPRALAPILAAALLAVPLMAAIGLGAQIALGLPYDLGNLLTRLPVGLGWPLMAALGEEFAWRGTLLPLMRRRVGLLRSALMVGILWGFWHLPADWIGLKSQGAWFWPEFLLQGPVLLTAHSIIVTWIWARSGGRVLAAILYHVGITSSAILLGNQTAFADHGLAFLGNFIGVAVVLSVSGIAAFKLKNLDRAAGPVASRSGE
ncbi:MAG TPA: CPBP family intramembrane glutamic endopeptidase [Rectinemataceae bacterium]|nr:CPBP family intramembrane glutamic endopeptidase [Rectinemataceae bacterium]